MGVQTGQKRRNEWIDWEFNTVLRHQRLLCVYTLESQEVSTKAYIDPCMLSTTVASGLLARDRQSGVKRLLITQPIN